jgi:hypothetical protein
MGKPGGVEAMIPPKTDTPLPKWVRLSASGECDLVADSTCTYFDHYDLPISQALKDRMDLWNDWFEEEENAAFFRCHPASEVWVYQGPESPYVNVAFDTEGAAIALLLMAELPDWTVLGYEYYAREATQPLARYCEMMAPPTKWDQELVPIPVRHKKMRL